MVDHVTTLVTPHRSCDPVWTEICGVIRDGGEWVASDSIGVDDLGFLMCDDHSKPKVICYTNNVRTMINRRCSHLWPTVLMTDPLPFYKNDEQNEKLQDYQYYVGMPVTSLTNKDSCCNRELGEIVKYEEKVTVLIVRGLLIELELADFFREWIPAFAITTHSAQGQTWDWQYAICEFSRMDRKMRYTAFSRSRRAGQVITLKL